MTKNELTPTHILIIGLSLVTIGTGALLLGQKIGGVAVFGGGLMIGAALDSLPEVMF